VLFQAADLHLTPTIWKDMPSMQGDSYAALDQIVAVCTAEGSKATLLLSGDIFDKSRPDSESVERFRMAMDRLSVNGVQVYAIQGQHEKADPPWATALGSVTYVGDGTPFEVDGLRIVGLDYTNSPDLQKTLKGLKKVDLLMIHQMAKQAIDIEGAWNFDIDWVNKSVKLILAGDYHGFLNVGRLYYPGATHFRKIDEIGNKCFLRVDPSDLSVEPQELWTRPVLQVRVINDEQLDEAIKAIMDADPYAEDRPEEIKQPLIVARYSPNVQSVVPRVEEACLKRSFLLRLKPLVGDAQDDTHTELPQAAATLHGCLDAIVDRGTDEELHSFVSALLDAEDSRLVLEETKQRLGIGG